MTKLPWNPSRGRLHFRGHRDSTEQNNAIETEIAVNSEWAEWREFWAAFSIETFANILQNFLSLLLRNVCKLFRYWTQPWCDLQNGVRNSGQASATPGDSPSTAADEQAQKENNHDVTMTTEAERLTEYLTMVTRTDNFMESSFIAVIGARSLYCFRTIFRIFFLITYRHYNVWGPRKHLCLFLFYEIYMYYSFIRLFNAFILALFSFLHK